jgi:hypothetical protein
MDPADAGVRVRRHVHVDARLPDAMADDVGYRKGDGKEFNEREVLVSWGEVVREYGAGKGEVEGGCFRRLL